jgi:hypothetical protein
MPMLVSFGGAEEWPGVMFTCSRRSSAPFSVTETLQKRIKNGPSDLILLELFQRPRDSSA